MAESAVSLVVHISLLLFAAYVTSVPLIGNRNKRGFLAVVGFAVLGAFSFILSFSLRGYLSREVPPSLFALLLCASLALVFGFAWWNRYLAAFPPAAMLGVLLVAVAGGAETIGSGWELLVAPPLLAGVLTARAMVNEQQGRAGAIVAALATIAVFAFPFYLNEMDALGWQAAQALHQAPGEVTSIHRRESVATIIYAGMAIGVLALTWVGTSGSESKPHRPQPREGEHGVTR